MKIKINTYHKKIFADTITPVEVYLKIRDIFPNSLLLENSDYMLANNNYSYICFNQIGHIKIKDYKVECKFPGGDYESKELEKGEKVSSIIHDYIEKFEIDNSKFKFFLHATNSSTNDPSLFITELACAIVYFSSSIADKYLISEVTFPLITFL